MVNCFDKGGIGLVYIHNQGGNVVFDTSISYNESGWGNGVQKNQVVKFLSMDVVFSFFYQLS